MAMISNLVGTRIRAIRSKRNLTQQQLADLADIPRATLATVEKDDANPSLAVVHKIATALNMTIDDLIIEHFQRVQAIRKEKMPQLESADGCYRSTVLSPPNSHHFLQQRFSLAPQSTHEGKPHPPGSEEYLIVLKGEIIIEVAEEAMHLSEGDSARFGGNIHHLYVNPTQGDAIGLVTILEK
ncbi:helix-turn-helix domain-containing protein [Pseudomonadota bacterium]